MSEDERLERYVKAINEADDYALTGMRDRRKFASFVMDVADEELREQLTVLQQERTEWREANAMLTLHAEESQKMIVAFRRRAEKAEATIERANSVLDEWYGTSDASALGAAVRAALDGDQS